MKLGNQIDLKVKYSTKFLIDKLEEHAYNHILDYAKAKRVYEDDMKDALEKLGGKAMSLATALAVAPDSNIELGEIRNAYNKLFSIVKPVDASEAYTQYIDLLRMNVTDFLELDISDANSIINDEWDWAVSAKTTNAFYSSRS